MKIIPLTKGQVTLVSDEDYERLATRKWCAHWNASTQQYYPVRRSRGKDVPMHRDIIKCPSELYIDHIDRNTLNNQRSNLRVCTFRQNSCNRVRKDQSRFGIGVFRNGNRFIARVVIDGKRRSVGSFTTAKAARMARDRAAIHYYGEYAVLNNQ